MRTIALITLISLGAAFMAGCSAIPALQPALPLPIPMQDVIFGTSGSNGTFVKQQIDLTGEESWTRYAAHITGYEGVSLTASVTNETGSIANPVGVQLRFYISDRGDLTPITIGQASLLLTADIPGGTRAVQYDSGTVPLSAQAGQTMRDGKFYLYATGSPSNISLQMTQVHMDMKVRVSLL